MGDGSRWVFGYGSLVWRPDFAHRERVPARLRGFARRFWQGSPDHRGRPDAPGRVVTLAPVAGAVCEGMAYRVSPEDWEAVLVRLDERESGGFERLDVTLELKAPGPDTIPALVYVAGEGNPNYLGPAPDESIAEQVRRSRGKSGSNAEYVLRLARALRELGCDDPHVEAIASRLTDGGGMLRAPEKETR